ncbi:hypothetical protein MMC07_009660 [Pseudocyphellaria aurata]|nr:hypothetical protein [Pseudocyphellaria aurata]
MQTIRPTTRADLNAQAQCIEEIERADSKDSRTRKPKTGFDNSEGPIVHFNVGIAHFTFDDSHEDGGYWTALKSSFTIDEINRDLTSDELCMSLVTNLRSQIKRPNLKGWISCGSADNWSLGRTDPSKAAPRDGAPWTNPKLLSKAIKDTSYERKPISGMLEKLVLIWLYYTPDAPESSLLAPPSVSRKFQQDTKGKKGKKGKKEKEIKPEPGLIKVEPKSEPSEESDLFVKSEPSELAIPKKVPKGKAVKSTQKRQRPVSAEMSTAKRIGTITRRQAKELEAHSESSDLSEPMDKFPGLEMLMNDGRGNGEMGKRFCKEGHGKTKELKRKPKEAKD